MNAVVKTQADAFKSGYRQLAPNIAHSLPSHVPPERFERAAMVMVQRNPELLSKADRRSLFLSLQRAAQDGLMPDGREGAIVLFGNQAQWMPMVAGLMKLARNSGEIASISANVAYKGEKFHVVLGDEERIEHERNLDLADNAEVVAAYAVATLKNGEKVREVMTRAQIEKVRAVSRAKNGGPWTAWFDQMAIKTVIRRLSKRLPLSTDRDGDERFQRAAEREDSSVDLATSGPTIDADPFEAASAGALPEMSGAEEIDAETGEILQPSDPDPIRARAESLAAEVSRYASEEAVKDFTKRADVRKLMTEWKASRPELFKLVEDATEARMAALAIEGVAA